ncbi:MAG: monofunctional biosynthetic peptidoglycan transglycosylase [Sediminibacterium sp.]|nr:monofunctional biosynthetic peptidoglycan transglycosylase [Sediminibacterium sp.]
MKKLWQRCLRYLLYIFIIQIVYIVALKWIMPPFTFTQLSTLFSTGIQRDYVDWNEISYQVKLAAIASEDQAFLDHWGVDWEATQKSLFPTKKKKKIIRGGGASTISQQTAKNVFLWQGNGFMRYVRKIPEFIYTWLIEIIWGKQRILEIYLNVIEMGNGVYGIEAAAQKYFHKSAQKLSATQAAQIIACLPNPKKFSVVPMSKRVGWRYPKILNQMRLISSEPTLQNFLKN